MPFPQQGVYNNMSITVSMAGGSDGVGSLPPMGQAVGVSNSNLGNASAVCSDQQVSEATPGVFSWFLVAVHLLRLFVDRRFCSWLCRCSRFRCSRTSSAR